MSNLLNINSALGCLFLTSSLATSLLLYKFKNGMADYQTKKLAEAQKQQEELMKRLEEERQRIEDSHIKITDDEQFNFILDVTKCISQFLLIFKNINNVQSSYQLTIEQSMQYLSTFYSQLIACVSHETKINMPHEILSNHAHVLIDSFRRFHSRAKYLMELERGLSNLEKVISLSTEESPTDISYCIYTKLMCGICRVHGEFEKEMEIAGTRLEKINELEKFDYNDFDNTEFVYYCIIKSLIAQEKYNQALDACFLLEKLSRHVFYGGFNVVSLKYICLIYLYMGDLNSAIEYANQVVTRSISPGFTLFRSPIFRTRRYILHSDPGMGESFVQLSIRRLKLGEHRHPLRLLTSGYLDIQFRSKDLSELYFTDELEVRAEKQIRIVISDEIYDYIEDINEPIMMYIEIYSDKSKEEKLGEHLQPLVIKCSKYKYEVSDLF